ATLPREYRKMLGLRRSPLPVVTTTRLVLWAVRTLLGGQSTSEDAARRRIARLESPVSRDGVDER
ncbi:MAG: DUF2236 domain-containing protein, partial [Microbacteriaceae bacterium]